MTSKLLIPLPPTLYPIHTRENILTPHKDPYKYFDTPDHEDCFKKIYFATYWGTKTALFVSFLDLMGHKQPNFPKAFGRVAYHMGGIAGSMMLGSAVSCAVANLRGNKDDEFNYIVGGASIGLIWGYRLRSTGLGSVIGVGMGFLGWMLKRAQIQDWQLLIPEPNYLAEENGVLGGQNWGDWRLKCIEIKDPGRKGLE